MFSIFKYTIIDLIRSRWTILYVIIYFLLTTGLFLLSNNNSKVIISLSNINLALIPLVGLLLGSLYYYTSREYIQLLLSQPIPRWKVFGGLFIGVSLSLGLAPVLGISISFIIMSSANGEELVLLLILLALTFILSIIFIALSFVISLLNENKLKGLGICLFSWMFFAFIYDGLFLLMLMYFKDYPLEKFSIAATLLNPIDMFRILILLKLDASAMLGYTGAVLQKFLGSSLGSLLMLLSLGFWIIVPSYFIFRISGRKDF